MVDDWARQWAERELAEHADEWECTRTPTGWACSPVRKSPWWRRAGRRVFSYLEGGED
jgi:hypothetical protein